MQRSILLMVSAVGLTSYATAQEAYRSPDELKKLSLDELVDVQITSAARRAEPLSQAANAIDVVTADDIMRAGATNIPDALRLVPEMQVAQIDGHTWAISARGFNNATGNKMQVLMDGRNLYTPLYSGVFWDVQQTFLPDLQQIEVIRGPGATLWGANAVNGVINIRTKSAQDTQGVLLFGGAGNEETAFVGLRYGGQVGKSTFYRIYVMQTNRDSLSLEGGGDAEDEYDMTQGGFRIDSKPNEDDALTLQGDLYHGEFGQLNMPDAKGEGGNLIGRWMRQLATDSSMMLQTYFDYTRRLIPDVFEEHRYSYDIEFQHSILIFDQHYVVYGANYHLSADDIDNLGPSLAFIPDNKTVHLVSGYVQDEFHIVPNEFSITAGSKFEYNTFSEFEFQPTARFTWNATPDQTLWGAISRAVRTPTRIDQDLVSPNPSSGAPALLLGNPDFGSETLVAYELGYRIRPARRLSLDLSGFYNDYDNLRSVESVSPAGPFIFRNRLEGTSYGASLTTKWVIADWWQIDGYVSVLQEDIHPGPGSTDLSNGTSEGNDPNCMFAIHSSLEFPHNVTFDSVLRYVGDLPNPPTPSYLTLDLRLAWTPNSRVEIAVVGRNLLDDKHPEFSAGPQGVTREVERSVFGTLKWHF